jgi:hypothetical protein
MIWGSALIAFVLTATPFLSGYLWSFERQSLGTVGFDIPLILPSAVFGLQPRDDFSLGLLPTTLLWVFCMTIVPILLQKLRTRGFSFAESILAITIYITFAFLAVRYGPNAYTTGKYVTVILTLVAPILVAKFLDLVLVGKILRRSVPISLVSLSLFFTLNTRVIDVPTQLWNKLQQLNSPSGSINIMTSHYSRGLIATALPKIEQVRVIVESAIWKEGMPNFQTPFIIDRSMFESGGFNPSHH